MGVKNRRTILPGMAAALLALALCQSAARAGEPLGSGSYAIDGRQGTFDVGHCVVMRIPGKGAKLQLIGSRDKLQVTINSNDLSDDYRKVQQASISFDPGVSSWTADYYLRDGAWERRGQKPVSGPLIRFSTGRLVVEGEFESIGASGPTPPVSGRIEAECPTLTADKVALLRNEGAPETVGEPTASVSFAGRELSFTPDMCVMKRIGSRGHMLNIRGEGEKLEAGVQDMRFSAEQTQQHVQLMFKDGTGIWRATRLQKSGKWQDVQGKPADGPLVVVDGTHVEAHGVLSLAGDESRTRTVHLEADCPAMAELSGH